ncbi:hypothetical protein Sjap_013854 [Stephania japonica]|uniref:Auxin response factor n=1 Tax=Stephania japonica TaxID=461633 RepID=A0AAP0NY28_9MAGN
MFRFSDSTSKTAMKESDRCLDSQFWHACAGGMVQIPPVNSKVYYFPQGHAEHTHGSLDFGNSRIPALVLCHVVAVKFMADPESDDVFAKIRLVPLKNDEPGFDGEGVYGIEEEQQQQQQKVASFAKTLTQSDANNGGGFSVPRYCAETIFPRLDFSADPPVQTVLAKDVHGQVWKFRHIYRGTPRRHLLTTGWSAFVNQKKLVAGDSIVFLRAENGDLCVGIRRAKRGGCGDGLESSGWNVSTANCVSPYKGFSALLRGDENKPTRDIGGGFRGRARVRPESVVEAAKLAANGQPFEVVYYPSASTPEFCVKAPAVRTALRIKWCPGMRFKMAFETEDSSRISWFMGTISSVQVADPIRWPNSPWRLLLVAWDEPDLLQNVKCVSPWLVELVSNMPAVHLSPFSPPRKKLRLPPDFPLDGSFQMPPIPSNLFATSSPLCCVSDDTPTGIQGARHAQFGIPFSNFYCNKPQMGLFPAHFQQLNHAAPPPKTSNSFITSEPNDSENVSCLLTMGASVHSSKKSDDTRKATHQFVLFGQPILTEQQISLSCSGDGSPAPENSSSDGNPEMVAKTNNPKPALHQLDRNDKSSGQDFLYDMHYLTTELGLKTNPCKVLMEAEDVGRTLDLSILGSYDKLYRKLSNMLGVERSTELNNSVSS